MNRLQDMLKNLSTKVNQMATTLNMSSAANRENLLGPDKKTDDIMSRATGLNNHGLVGFQRQIMKGINIGEARNSLFLSSFCIVEVRLLYMRLWCSSRVA